MNRSMYFVSVGEFDRVCSRFLPKICDGFISMFDILIIVCVIRSASFFWRQDLCGLFGAAELTRACATSQTVLASYDLYFTHRIRTLHSMCQRARKLFFTFMGQGSSASKCEHSTLRWNGCTFTRTEASARKSSPSTCSLYIPASPFSLCALGRIREAISSLPLSLIGFPDGVSIRERGRAESEFILGAVGVRTRMGFNGRLHQILFLR